MSVHLYNLSMILSKSITQPEHVRNYIHILFNLICYYVRFAKKNIFSAIKIIILKKVYILNYIVFTFLIKIKIFEIIILKFVIL